MVKGENIYDHLNTCLKGIKNNSFFILKNPSKIETNECFLNLRYIQPKTSKYGIRWRKKNKPKVNIIKKLEQYYQCD